MTLWKIGQWWFFFGTCCWIFNTIFDGITSFRLFSGSLLCVMMWYAYFADKEEIAELPLSEKEQP